MAEPLLTCPSTWLKGTLEPNSKTGLIQKVDSGGTPSTSEPDYWDGGIAWLTPKEITGNFDGIYVTTTERTITEEGLRGSAAKLLPPNTVMLTKRAPVGAVAINALPMSTNQGFLNFQCGGLLRPLYLAYWFKANREYLDKIANGSTYPELYQTDLFEFEISVPPLEIQDKILSVISAIQYLTLLGLPLEQSVTDPAEMIHMQQLRQKLSLIRDKMLPLLLSGELEVASVSINFLKELG